MSDNILPFKIPEPEDFSYMVYNDTEIRGVVGKNVDMEMLMDDNGFMFNGEYVSREELIALVLISGVWQDVQDKPPTEGKNDE